MKWTAIMYAYGDYHQLGTYKSLEDAKNAVEREIGKKMRKKRISNEEYELDGRHLAITVNSAKLGGYENLKEGLVHELRMVKSDIIHLLSKRNKSTLPYKVYTLNKNTLHIGGDAALEPDGMAMDMTEAFGSMFEFVGKVRGPRDGEHVYKFTITKEEAMKENTRMAQLAGCLNEASNPYDSIERKRKECKDGIKTMVKHMHDIEKSLNKTLVKAEDDDKLDDMTSAMMSWTETLRVMAVSIERLDPVYARGKY